MGKKDERVEAYMAKIPEFAKPILAHLRELVHNTCPEVEETWKWSFPVFVYKGAILCNMAAFKEHCAFGFWKASLMPDEAQILDTGNRDGMGHLGKIKSPADLPADEVLVKYIRTAMKLNEDGIKLPARNRPTEKDKKELVVPEYLLQALGTDEVALRNFEAFPYSHKKEYVQWLEEAKTDATRTRRLAQAVEMIAEGKDRNWKYKSC